MIANSSNKHAKHIQASTVLTRPASKEAPLGAGASDLLSCVRVGAQRYCTFFLLLSAAGSALTQTGFSL